MHPVSLSRPTEHIVAFYRSDDFVVEQVASFISEGLAANEHVIAIATTHHWNAITARLDESGIDYGRATSAGQLVLIEAEEALDAVTVNGKVSVERFGAMLAPLVKPGTRTRIYGELVSLLAQRGDVDAAVAVERLGHELAHAQNIRVLCGYHVNGARTLTAAEIARIQETHDRSVLEDSAYAGAWGATVHVGLRSIPRGPVLREPAVARRDGRSVSWRRFRRGLARRGHRHA